MVRDDQLGMDCRNGIKGLEGHTLRNKACSETIGFGLLLVWWSEGKGVLNQA